MTDLGTALEQASASPETRSVADYIEAMRPEIEKSLQSEQGAAILARHYYNAVRYTPLLMQCTPESLVAALLLSAQVRLEPGPLGHVYLVPFRNAKRDVHEVVWMLGYTGIVELARRGGAAGLRATVVRAGDEFTPPWQDEKGSHWRHVPNLEAADAARIGGLVTWKEGTERVALLMPPERVDVAVKASRNPGAAGLREEDWYWRKTAIRFARPWLPLTTDSGFAAAYQYDGGIASGIDVEAGAAFPVIEVGDDAA
jgi:recombination protein RecT